MKNLIHLFTLAFFLFAISACKKARKNVDDYYPTVTTVSAIVNQDGTVEVTADVTLKEGELQYLGFCMDTLPMPTMLQNQEIVTELVDGKQFKHTYTMIFDPAKTYYFRSWAASNEGYTYGNVIRLTNIKATPIEAPCSLVPNSSNIGINGSGGTVYKVTAVDHFSSTWDIDVEGYDAAAGRLKLRFGSELKTKIYTTTEESPYGDLVYISVTSGFTSGQLLAGSKVFVNSLSQGVYEITICNAPWQISGTTVTADLNARFKSPF
jgi:hypothetical protein